MRRRIALGLLLASIAPAGLAQRAAAPAGTVEPAEELRAELLRTGLYLISGGGCNSLLRLSQAGCLLVDGKLPGTYRALMSQIRRINKISDLPLRAVIFTNHHDAHAGNRAQFADRGVALLAQANALARLASSSRAAPDAGPFGAREHHDRSFGFERSHTFRIGGVEIRLHHFGPAVTDNDIVVQFPDLRVVALGELHAVSAPVPDFDAGGTLSGWGAALDQVLTLDFDLAVPGTGPPLNRSELSDFKARLDTLISRATALVRIGVDPGQFAERLATQDLGWKLDLDADVVRRLYADLKRTP